MHAEIKIFEKRPESFAPKIEVAATYVHLNGKLLLLELASHKQEAGAWGVPAGKLEADELLIPVKGAQRELFEETGIEIDLDAFQSLGALYMRKPNMDYVYHLFGVRLDTVPSVLLSPEHTTHRWVSRSEADNLPLMHGAAQALDAYDRRSSREHEHK